MKTIGLIGGMSWESSLEYYRLINEEVKVKLGGLHSAKCILYSVDFEEIERYQAEGDWESSGKLLGDVALSLEKAGAEMIVICTNTIIKWLDILKKKSVYRFYTLLIQPQNKLKSPKSVRLVYLALNIRWSKTFIKHELSLMVSRF